MKCAPQDHVLNSWPVAGCAFWELVENVGHGTQLGEISHWECW
jgi:hypothetical protein